MQGRGWTAAGALKVGDRVATRSGEWVPIAELFDTEQWETVYNVRVAEYQTHFVGEEHWGWAAWAHNTYTGLIDALNVIFEKGFANLGIKPKDAARVANSANTPAAWVEFQSLLKGANL